MWYLMSEGKCDKCQTIYPLAVAFGKGHCGCGGNVSRMTYGEVCGLYRYWADCTPLRTLPMKLVVSSDILGTS